jgi:hypothetical protein
MIPKKQTIVHDPEKKLVGNCWTSCIASLLEMEVDDIPHFYRDFSNPITATYKWLDELGYVMVEFSYKNLENFVQMSYFGYHIIVGPSPRFSSILHAVIGLNGEPFFDPHPEGTMIDGNEDDWKLIFISKRITNGK